MHTEIRRYQKNNNASLADFHPVLQRVYAHRGIDSVDAVQRKLQQLHDFRSMGGIETAVARIVSALQQQQRILIIGDFDADGATSSALAVSALRTFGGQHVEFLVPNRFAYGYGLTPEIVDMAKQWQPDLIITVDNGTSSVDGVNRARELEIDVIVTDHHLPGEQLPEAVAIVNPNLVGDGFPSKNLAGVGVIFYVMSAVRRGLIEQNYFSEQDAPAMSQWLDLVALGTVADVVPLDQNNRILVHHGLQRMQKGLVRPGIKALLDIANRDITKLSATDLGFAVAPRLNAAGRLDDMSLGIDCLLASTQEEAHAKALELDGLNQERKAIEQSMQEQAMIALQKLKFQRDVDMPYGLCLFDETWHQGVIGILAGRIKERYHRPVIVFADCGDGDVKGSARSVQGIHIRDVLDALAKRYPTLMTKFGGHAMAAGLSLKRQQLAEFSRAFDEILRETIDPVYLQSYLMSDGELAQSDFTMQLADIIRQAGPWGQQFPEPIFDNEFTLIQQRLLGGKHLKCVLQLPGSSQLLNAIAFNINADHWPNPNCHRVRAAYKLEINEYQGATTLQLQIQTMEPLTT